MSPQGTVPINVVSMYGHNSKQPLVALTVRDVSVQMSPEKARELGHWLIEAAEAAEQDAFMNEYARDALGGDERTAANLMMEFRRWRERRRERLQQEGEHE